MAHKLEIQYGLTADELLTAIDNRFRAKVTLEGAVAEVQVEKTLFKLKNEGIIREFITHDQDGYADFSIWLEAREEPLLLECKNIRNHDEAYREKGKIVAYKVETQKTRTSNSDPSSRFYAYSQFDILAVCLGKKTGNWKDFLFIKTINLEKHKSYSEKLAVMHKVPVLYHSTDLHPWYDKLEDLLVTYKIRDRI